jgi:myosin heavy subunit
LTCTLFESELADCKVPELKKAGFPVGPELTLEYSKMSEAGLNDMVEIDELNPATLLFNMSQMYNRYDIFVYVGPILLVMNPFKALPHLGTLELKAKYMEICNHP